MKKAELAEALRGARLDPVRIAERQAVWDKLEIRRQIIAAKRDAWRAEVIAHGGPLAKGMLKAEAEIARRFKEAGVE